MYTVEVTVRSLDGDLDVDLAIPLQENATVEHLVTAIIAKLKWPRVDSAGHTVQYVAIDQDGALIPRVDTLDAAGIFRGSVVTVAPLGDEAQR